MSIEDGINPQEKTPEKFPSKEEIQSTLELILKGKEYTELRVNLDATGVCLYEIEVKLENGYRIEYNFQKAKNNYRDASLDPFAQFSASIHMTKYDKDGIPYTGDCVANYLDGVWTTYN